MKYLIYLYQNKILKLLNRLVSLFTLHALPFTHHPSLVTHHPSLVTHHPSLVTHHSSLLTHHSSLLTHHSSLITLLALLICSLLFSSCNSSTDTKEKFDVQGHRGCRGLMPENTIEGFIKAIDLGVTTLEMDLVITKDSQVLLSHEPYMSSNICLDSTGAEIPIQGQKLLNIFQMNYAEIKKFDCGSKHFEDFPLQEKFVVHKPLLKEVIDAVEKHIAENNLPKVKYNIEIKGGHKFEAYLNDNKKDGVKFFPKPEVFAPLVLDVVREKGILDRTIIQSFDIQCLRAAKEYEPKVKIAQLIHYSNQLAYKLNIQNLGFKPDIYSPEHSKVIPGMITYMKEEGIKVIPWTVNDMERMITLIGMGVDGIITDYPDRLITLLESY